MKWNPNAEKYLLFYEYDAARSFSNYNHELSLTGCKEEQEREDSASGTGSRVTGITSGGGVSAGGAGVSGS